MKNKLDFFITIWYNGLIMGDTMKNLLVMITVILLMGMCSGCKATQSGDVIQLSDDNTVQINLPIFPETATYVQKKLFEKDSKLKPGKPIYLVLNTPGGSITDGLMIIETAKSLKRPVHTISIFSASMGFVISQYLDERLALNSAILMTHKAKVGGVGGEIPGSFINMAQYLLNFINNINEKIAIRSGMELEAYNKLIESDYWMGSVQAKDHNFIDRVVTISCDKSLQRYEDPQEIDVGFFAITLQFHKCPLITQPQIVKGNSQFADLLVNRKAELIGRFPHLFR